VSILLWDIMPCNVNMKGNRPAEGVEIKQGLLGNDNQKGGLRAEAARL
jgi:hypothetical protein